MIPRQTFLIDNIEVMENGVINFRKVTTTIDENNQSKQTFHRSSLIPNQDISDQPPSIKELCLSTWTPDVIVAYEEQTKIRA